jgi:FAD-dependent urate hydroxylase
MQESGGKILLDLKRLRILIVGAGIAGLALGRALRQHGFLADIIERKAGWDDAGTGMYLPGNAIRALSALNLDAEIVKRAARIQTQRFCDRRGRLLSDVNLDSVWSEVGPCVAVHRADLHFVLREYGDVVPIRMGVALVALDLAGDFALAHLSNGARERYDLVIGADGIASTVRRLAFSDVGRRALNLWGWRFVIPCPPQVTAWSVLMNRQSACLTMPIGGGRAYCYVDLMDGEPPTSPERSANRLREVLSGFGDPAIAMLQALEGEIAIHAAPIEEIVLDGWSRGRALLIGDAAHAMNPSMAQGAAMAIEDALVLAECLSRQDNIGLAVSAYEARRRRRVQWVLAMTHRRDRIRKLHPALRNIVLRAFGERVYRSHYRPLLASP